MQPFFRLLLWLLRAAIIILILWGTIATLRNNPYTHQQWIDLLVFGVVQGSIYALLATGYTLVYRVLRLIHFAHGETFMAGAMTATIFIAAPLSSSGFLARQPIVALLMIAIVAIAASVLIAVLTERVAYRPLRNSPRQMALIAGLGASIFWRHFFSGLYGPEVRAFPQVPALEGVFALFETEMLRSYFVVVIVAVLALLGHGFFLKRTKSGVAIRAVADNREAAALVGIDVDRIIRVAFTVGAVMAGVAGVLYVLVYGKAHYFMGFFPGIKAFTAAVLGGIGSLPGAAIGGFLLGVIESIGPGTILEGLGIPAPYQLRDVFAVAMLFIVLVFRPQGILGQPLAREKD